MHGPTNKQETNNNRNDQDAGNTNNKQETNQTINKQCSRSTANPTIRKPTTQSNITSTACLDTLCEVRLICVTVKSHSSNTRMVHNLCFTYPTTPAWSHQQTGDQQRQQHQQQPAGPIRKLDPNNKQETNLTINRQSSRSNSQANKQETQPHNLLPDLRDRQKHRINNP